MLKIGDITIDTIADLDPFAIPIDLIFPGRAVAELEHIRPILEHHHVDFEAEKILLGVHSHLVRANGLNILVDTCVGLHKPRPRRAGDWHHRESSVYLDELARHGLTPDDIDIVVCTHLHADHIGWNTKLVDGKWVPTFPNARYLVNEQEFTHWQELERKEPGQHNHGAFVDSVQPVADAGQIDFVADGHQVAEGLSLKAIPGHTPGQLGLCICHAKETAFICADAIHTVVQVYHPEWVSRFCSDGETAVATRIALLEEAADNGTTLIPAHLRHFSAMRIRLTAGGFEPDLIP